MSGLNPGLSHEQQRALGETRRQLIHRLIATHGPLSAPALSDYTEIKLSTIRDYLHRMTTEGLLVADKILDKTSDKGTVRVLYKLPDESDYDEEFRRPVYRTYPSNHKRDDLVAALFGPAKGQP